MKRKSLKILTCALGILMIGGLLSGCAEKKDDSSTTTQASAAQTNNDTKIEGNITASGSTALFPLAGQVAKIFQQKYPDATINVQGGGSGTGLKDVEAGNVQIGNSDVYAKDKLDPTKAAELVDHQVCAVGFAAVVNSSVTVDNLTKDQLIGIFTGKYTNWKQVGGSDMQIVIISRPDSSGTKATFKKYALDGAKEVTGQALKEDSSATVAKAVKETKGAICYLASSYLNDDKNKDGLKVLKFNGVEMNKENICNGQYPIWAFEHMYTKGEATGLAKAFIDYFKTDEVKQIIEKLGYISSDDIKVKGDK